MARNPAIRVLVTGMGGELGSRVASLLEAERTVESIVGVDVDPPRVRLHRAMFHRIDPRDRRKLLRLVHDVEPTHVVHVGVYEPDARATPRVAATRTSSGTLTVLGAAAETGQLARIVLRSGIEVYGRRRGSPTVPDESVPPDPTSDFGRTLLEAERIADAAGLDAGVPVATLRLAPVAGPHVPSPLVRLLRLPVVPFETFADPSFSLIHQEDAARAFVSALLGDFHGAVNVVAPGAVTAAQAARLGGRLPLPVTGPGWALASRAAELLGSPVPSHVLELLRRGRSADASAMHDALGFSPEYPTLDVVKAIFEWAPVAPLRLAGQDAA